jgi:hypothetical protein
MLDYSDLIGDPFKKGGRDRKGWDCYGLLIELHRRLGQKAPDYISPTDKTAIAALLHSEKAHGWTEVWSRKPEGVPFNIGLVKPYQDILIEIRGVPFHVGMVISPTKFIHVWEDSGGVLVERMEYWKHRICGVYSLNDEHV